MRRFGTVVAVFLAAALCAGASIGAETREKIPGKIVLKVYEKKPVTFDHKGHAQRIGKCETCHHKTDSEKCSDCHGAKRDGDTPSFREAMHYRCKNCHMKTNKKVKGACQECHPNVPSVPSGK
jgi:hypothetical protein